MLPAEPLTFPEFCLLAGEGQKADLIEGVMYMASPDNTYANDLSVWLLRLVGDYNEIKDVGRVFGLRVAFRLDEHNAPEPDLGFVLKKRLHLVRKGFVKGAPDLAVEIVSPDSIERDYEIKRLLYQKAQEKEYWIIDEERKKVTWLTLGKDGKYREIRPSKGVLHSRVLVGFWLRPAWLWQETRPMKFDALNQILA
jgi:Uma2 family endonuclease